MHGFKLIFLLVLMSAWSSTVLKAQQHRLLTYSGNKGESKVLHHPKEWQLKRVQILAAMQSVTGSLPNRTNLPQLQIQYTDSAKGDGYTRYNIRFDAAEKEVVAAYLYVPDQAGIPKKLPAMLALHPTGDLGKKIVDGQGDLSNRAYAKELAKRGYVVIAPDYPSFGDVKDYDFKTDRYQSGTMKAIFDNMRCVDLLQGRSDVDTSRIGVIGHSLGGHNAIFTAAFDPRLKVVVSSCGWTLLHDYFNGDSASAGKYGGNLWPWAQERYMPLMREKYHLDPDKIPFDFDEIIAAIAPRAFFSNSPVNDANFNADGVKKGIANLATAYHFLNVPQNLQVRYPNSGHDFPFQTRWQAYHFIDSVFGRTRKKEAGYDYQDNPQYFKRLELFAGEKGKKDIVMLGNSLTERGQWDEILGRTDVANRGIGSDVTEGYINRMNYVFNLQPKICFIEGGVNDLGRSIPQEIIINNLAILIDTLRDSGITPVLNTVTYVAANYQAFEPKAFNHRIKRLNRAIRRLAKEKNVALIDLNPEISDGKYLLKQFVIEDGIHYTAETYLQWKKEILKIVQQKGGGWVQEQPQAAWQPRDSQGELVFKNKMWIFGGWFNSQEAPPRDVWSSSDGKNWELVNAAAPWIHSDLPMSVVFKNKMWMMGGWYKGRLEGHSASNQVWSSKDGKKWRAETNAAAWSPRIAAAVVEFKGKLWLMGGTENYYFGDRNSLKNDVWYTSNGKDWKLATADAGWPPRAYHQAVVLNGKIYLFGGGNYVPQYFALNDVWSSEDGVRWTKVTDAPWHERIWFSGVVYRNRIWVMGGWSNNPYKNWPDVWYSKDGKEWKQYTASSVWKERHEASAFVFRDKIWVAGGMTPPLVNDVWSLQLPENW